MCLCITIALSVDSTKAETHVLEDRNSTATVDDEALVKGINSWYVDGADNLYQQWFWLRIGDTAAEQTIDSIDPDGPLVSLTDSDFDPGAESLQLRYEGADLQIDVSLELVGGTPGSGTSDLVEAISITNMGTSVLDLHFFQYVDFDLGTFINDDTVWLENANTFIQTDIGGAWISETADVPTPSRHEAALYDATLTKLEDLNPDILNNVSGPTTGDATWAFQWDFELGAGSSYIISKNKHLVIPEPTTICLLGLGGLLLCRRRRL
jgi:hypothetical protein